MFIRNHYKFTLLTITGITGVILSLIIFVILYERIDKENKDIIISDAIKWQFKNKSIISLPAEISNDYKKTMTKYSAETYKTNTLILGSSTAMGIRNLFFPETHVFFNSAKSSNPLSRTISETVFYIHTYDEIKHIFISIDWGLGFPYRATPVGQFEMPIEQVNINSLFAKIKDAISLQRIKIVFSNLKNDIFNKSNSIYTCPKEDAQGMDIFNATHPRICDGFRYDGSATFSHFSSLNKSKWEKLLKNSKSLRYRKSLKLTKGVVNTAYLEQLNKINLKLKQRNGGLVLLIPPMMPNLVSNIEKSSVAPYLETTINDIELFAKKNDIKLINASKSEDYGCSHEDFFDQHHAFYSCYEKVFKEYFKSK